MSLFSDLLANPYTLKYYLVELAPYDPSQSSTVNLYYSDQGFITEPGDSPANQHYEPRVKEALNIERSLFGQGRLRGRVDVSFGMVRLNAAEFGRPENRTGNLDALATYNWDARKVKVLLGGEDFGYPDYGTVFEGTAQGIDLRSDILKIRLRDGLEELDVEIQETAFAGTGGKEGSSEVEDQLKPRTYGQVRNIEPVYIGNVDLGGGDGSLHTFAYHDGEAKGAQGVYSDGNALTEVTGSAPTSGEWRDHPDDGLFQLGGSTLDTVITADVEGAEDSGGTYLSTVADIIGEIITSTSSLTMESGTVSGLNSKNNATVGIWIPNGANTLDVLSRISDSIGAFYTPTRTGEVRLGRVEAPASDGNEDATFNETDILALERRSTALPIKAARVQYQRIWRTHSFREIAGAVSDSRRAKLQKKWRETLDSNSSVETAHPLAQEEVFTTLLDSSSAASTEATRLKDLFSADREVFEVEVKTQPFQRELGDTVKLTTDQTERYNLKNGANFVVIGLKEVAADNRVTMTVWG